MEENKKEEMLDAFIKKELKQLEMESPSKDFTNSIMNVILEEEKISTPESNENPLISIRIWLLLGSLFIGSLWVIYKGKSMDGNAMPNIDFGNLGEYINVTNFLNNIPVSNTTLYAFLFLALMFFVQGYFIKKYFEERINL